MVQRLIRRIGKTDRAFLLGDGPAVQTSVNSSGWSLREKFGHQAVAVGLAAPVLDLLQVRLSSADNVITSLRMTALRMAENQLYDS